MCIVQFHASSVAPPSCSGPLYKDSGALPPLSVPYLRSRRTACIVTHAITTRVLGQVARQPSGCFCGAVFCPVWQLSLPIPLVPDRSKIQPPAATIRLRILEGPPLPHNSTASFQCLHRDSTHSPPPRALAHAKAPSQTENGPAPNNFPSSSAPAAISIQDPLVPPVIFLHTL
jgi:hypothetical protein